LHLGFFDKKINVIDKAPNDKAPEKKGKDISDMSKDELIAYAKKHGHKTIK
jgi:hypothetical protein